jgi:YbgC/YbaW family acyl-CoA thioester hydrolase
VSTSDNGLAVLPSVVLHRRVEWHDTDAAGHHHHGAVLRWVEAAESELLRRRGVADLFGRIPRVHYEVDYRARLWFGQPIQVELAVAAVGEKSVRYEFVVRGDDVVAATGNMVITMAAPDSPRAVPWSPEVRVALSTGGPQLDER